MTVKKIPPYLQIGSNILNDRRIKHLNKQMPNGQGLGLFFGLKFILLHEPNQKCYFTDLEIIADDLRTSEQLLRTVIESFNLFIVDKDETGEWFFCPILNDAMRPYFEKCKTNRENALIGAQKKKLKQLQQIVDMRKKLSEDDSSVRSQNDCNANISNVSNISNISNLNEKFEDLNKYLLDKQIKKDKETDRLENLAAQKEIEF